MNWLSDFLASRKQKVVIEGHFSEWLIVTSGSILGPFLFLVYISDLSVVTCNAELFADDTVLHHHNAHTSNCEQLEQDLLIASEWCNSRLITLKPEKCEVLHVSRKKTCQQHKNLVVWLESSLSWNYHINSI